MLGRYELIERVAAGGMAEVFRAIQRGDRGFRKQVAVKRILPALCQEPEIVKMFRDEARLASRLSHPNIAQVFDLAEVEGGLLIAMEWVAGKDLRKVLQRATSQGPALTLPRACAILLGLARALGYAHGAKDLEGEAMLLVHRDVSPHNLMLSFDGGVKLTDFGIAKALGRSTDTRDGTLKGKVAYMSPEQARGEEVDARTDVFALGIVAWELLSSRRLFSAESDQAILRAVLERRIEPSFPSLGEAPEGLNELVMEALERDLDKRLPSAQAFAARLESILHAAHYSPQSMLLGDWLHALFPGEQERAAGGTARLPKAMLSRAAGAKAPEDTGADLLRDAAPSISLSLSDDSLALDPEPDLAPGPDMTTDRARGASLKDLEGTHSELGRRRPSAQSDPRRRATQATQEKASKSAPRPRTSWPHRVILGIGALGAATLLMLLTPLGSILLSVASPKTSEDPTKGGETVPPVAKLPLPPHEPPSDQASPAASHADEPPTVKLARESSAKPTRGPAAIATPKKQSPSRGSASSPSRPPSPKRSPRRRPSPNSPSGSRRAVQQAPAQSPGDKAEGLGAGLASTTATDGPSSFQSAPPTIMVPRIPRPKVRTPSLPQGLRLGVRLISSARPGISVKLKLTGEGLSDAGHVWLHRGQVLLASTARATQRGYEDRLLMRVSVELPWPESELPSGDTPAGQVGKRSLFLAHAIYRDGNPGIPGGDPSDPEALPLLPTGELFELELDRAFPD